MAEAAGIEPAFLGARVVVRYEEGPSRRSPGTPRVPRSRVRSRLIRPPAEAPAARPWRSRSNARASLVRLAGRRSARAQQPVGVHTARLGRRASDRAPPGQRYWPRAPLSILISGYRRFLLGPSRDAIPLAKPRDSVGMNWAVAVEQEFRGDPSAAPENHSSGVPRAVSSVMRGTARQIEQSGRRFGNGGVGHNSKKDVTLVRVGQAARTRWGGDRLRGARFHNHRPEDRYQSERRCTPPPSKRYKLLFVATGRNRLHGKDLGVPRKSSKSCRNIVSAG